MLTRIFSAALYGVDAAQVEIEVNTARGNPQMIIVGLPDAAVRESRDRVTTAIAQSGLSNPQGRTTINLAPADLKKEGPSFDLPIALGLVAAQDGLDAPQLAPYCAVGELALDGAVRPVRGVLSIALEARARGRQILLVPRQNAEEAAAVRGLTIYGVRNLRESVAIIQGECPLEPVPPTSWERSFSEEGPDFAEVKGQAHVKRALEVAVAGGHNLLMVGPPGTGKSMLAKRIPSIMPALSEEEALETRKIHSVAGRRRAPANHHRPFRSPHHTISDAGLLGGSTHPSPGEVSLAHHGVLFLDELPEFRRSTLEVMRQPLEDGEVTISRAAGTMTFPARFMLVAAMNPCPCGYYGDLKRECRCTAAQVEKYRQRISGPLLDRIDLHVAVPLIDPRELSTPGRGESSTAIRQRVESARNRQNQRFASDLRVHCNAEMSPRWMRQCCDLDAEAKALLHQAIEELHFSARSYDRILKVARTLADLESVEKIAPAHIAEAIQYRTLDRNLWV